MGPFGRREREWRSMAAEKVADVDGWVLDAACGTGIMFRFLSGGSFGGMIIAMDASRQMVKKARKKLEAEGPRTSVILADVGRLPIKEGCLGAVLCVFSLTTINSPARAVLEFIRVLSEGSRLIVLDNEIPPNALVRVLHTALVPISRAFCRTYIDRDIRSVLDGQNELRMEGETHFLGGMVGLYEYSKREMQLGTKYTKVQCHLIGKSANGGLYSGIYL